jgi:hypothetical protein
MSGVRCNTDTCKAKIPWFGSFLGDLVVSAAKAATDLHIVLPRMAERHERRRRRQKGRRREEKT